VNDQVFILEGTALRSVPARPFRAGLFGKTLEEALQVLIERHPDQIPGSRIDPRGAAALRPPRP
jgi:hypothetical protein